jgi:hypothetical protein
MPVVGAFHSIKCGLSEISDAKSIYWRNWCRPILILFALAAFQMNDVAVVRSLVQKLWA